MRFNKKGSAVLQLTLMLFSMFAFAFIMSDKAIVTAITSEASYCCERTRDGASCQNAPESECSPSAKAAPTSCESTSYCKTGTCYNSKEGLCMSNTPQVTCEADGDNTWDARPMNQVPQCQLGCCIIADQAAFVTLTKCKKMSTEFGVANNYRSDIADELSCIAMAQSQDMGACVYERDYERVCDFTTRNECGAADGIETSEGAEIITSSEKKFYKDFLCSNDDLATTCARQATTECYQGDVYWVDSCGNKENVYAGDSDAEKADSWANGKVASPSVNAEGDCNYLAGTRCAAKEGIFNSGVEHECRLTVCRDRDDNPRKNGESWCVSPGLEGVNEYDYDYKNPGESDYTGSSADKVGSRYFREICIDGEVVVEPCSDYRNEICIQDEIITQDVSEGFGTAACRVNRWQDCAAQVWQDDCESGARDCQWRIPVKGMNVEESVLGNYGVCVPNFPPGLKFWEDSSSEEVCKQGNVECTVEFERGIFDKIGDWKGGEGAGFEAKTNEECLEEDWALSANGICASLGDCGGYVNYNEDLGAGGYRWVSATNEDGPWESEVLKFTSLKSEIRSYVTANVATLITGRAIAGLGTITGMVSLGEAYERELLTASTFIYGDPDRETYTIDNQGTVRNTKGTKFYQNSANEWGYGPADNFIILDKNNQNKFTQDYFNTAHAKWTVAKKNVDSIPKTAPGTIPMGDGTGTGTSAIPVLTDAAMLELAKYECNVDESRVWNKATNTCDSIYNPEYCKGINKIYVEGGCIDPMRCAECTSQECNPATGNCDLKDSGKECGYLDGIGDNIVTAKYTYCTDETKTCHVDKCIPKDEAKKITNETITGLLGFGKALIIGGGAAWASYQGAAMFGGILGFDEGETKTLQESAAIAAGIYAFTTKWSATSKTKWASPWTAGAIAVAYFALTYRDTESITVEFQCLPWEAPDGTDYDCEVCNDDTLPCSEYRCRSLGLNCEIVNKGTTEEKCVNVNPNDVNQPIVIPSYSALADDYSYSNVVTSPPSPGFTITNDASDNGCIPAFTPVQFGIYTTDGEDGRGEPAQCKIDFEHTTSYEEMRSYMGSSNLYKYNHSEYITLPTAREIENSSLSIENGKDLTFFIRCKDKTGNINEAEYSVNFCVDPTPDTTAPKIIATSIKDGSCVGEGQKTAPVKFYTDEPSYCKWSNQDQDYDSMANEMVCSRRADNNLLYPCSAELSGIPMDGADFYIRCEDDGETHNNPRGSEFNNKMKESLKFSLRGSTGLLMRNLQPNGSEIIYGAISPMPVELYAETSMGCDNGLATCAYSDEYSETGSGYIDFFDTNNEDGIHTQLLNLEEDTHEYFIRCIDAGGNIIEDSIEFKLDIDEDAPIVARVYEEAGMLKIVTVRDSECSYSFESCAFEFDEGTVMPYPNSTIHVAEWSPDKTFFIKCRDEFRNVEDGCSITVRPTKDFL
ncbi:hypothetical protein KAS08_01795 [Candidatus Pacearchaeota archaeon]|nr:hypothetical protein [Candidatus Pacearchaeota archaeon]